MGKDIRESEGFEGLKKCTIKKLPQHTPPFMAGMNARQAGGEAPPFKAESFTAYFVFVEFLVYI